MSAYGWLFGRACAFVRLRVWLAVCVFVFWVGCSCAKLFDCACAVACFVCVFVCGRVFVRLVDWLRACSLRVFCLFAYVRACLRVCVFACAVVCLFGCVCACVCVCGGWLVESTFMCVFVCVCLIVRARACVCV